MNCPTCDSPDPRMHPAVQHEGEVEVCQDRYHNVDVWLFETQHSETPFICRDGKLMCDHTRDALDDWMRSPIRDGESLHLKVTYRSVSQEKFDEWRNNGLVS